MENKTLETKTGKRESEPAINTEKRSKRLKNGIIKALAGLVLVSTLISGGGCRDIIQEGQDNSVKKRCQEQLEQAKIDLHQYPNISSIEIEGAFFQNEADIRKATVLEFLKNNPKYKVDFIHGKAIISRVSCETSASRISHI